ncbi:MAG: SPOR domain-containing protein [Betaproteobacteria bacterium]|nr:SPOR domain-containing protein [Betaproteobacteria bacterium]
MHYKLAPLSRRELEEYVDHRMTVAGGNACTFSVRALDLIYQLSGGIPRVVNTLCGEGLLAAYVAGRRKVEVGDLDESGAASGGMTTVAEASMPIPPARTDTDGTSSPGAGSKAGSAGRDRGDASHGTPKPAPQLATRQQAAEGRGGRAVEPKRGRVVGRALGAVLLLAAVVLGGLAATGRFDVFEAIGDVLHRPEDAELSERTTPEGIDAEPRADATTSVVGARIGAEAARDSSTALAADPVSEQHALQAEAGEVVPPPVEPAVSSPGAGSPQRAAAPTTTTVETAGGTQVPAAAAPEASEPSGNIATDGPLYLHVSSFRTPDHAGILARQYTDAGLPAIVRQQFVREVSWYRVYLGPFASHAEAVARANALRDSGSITYYKVMSLGDVDAQ